MNNILVTGGSGYIGSHTLISLIENGFNPIVVDNLSNSSLEALKRVETICKTTIPFHQGDIRDQVFLDEVFCQNKIKAVIHFAGLKSVGESNQKPLEYYDNNVNGTNVLLHSMRAAKIYNFIFSSSATVYGDPSSTPITEDFPLSATNPYGRSKLIVEDICRELTKPDACEENGPFKIALLRYFNPVGAHQSGTIGEDPKGIPNNLLPYISQVAIGKRKKLSIYGNDYATVDGTGVRDYIHVMDLARGHVNTLEWLLKQDNNEAICRSFNLGTGTGYSVLEILRSFEKVSKTPIPFQVAARRNGDIAKCFASVDRAKNELQWTAKKSLDDMMSDTWKWQKNNPEGYQ